MVQFTLFIEHLLGVGGKEAGYRTIVPVRPQLCKQILYIDTTMY